jgi:NAD(P)-dependent dehydrogenase (short-subunit alcohol dehydrogenase family)
VSRCVQRDGIHRDQPEAATRQREAAEQPEANADIDRYIEAIPLGRLAQSADIANVVAFLACPQGHWINGQVICANGRIL